MIKNKIIILLLFLISSCLLNTGNQRTPASNSTIRYEFLGDIEGNYTKFLRYIEGSGFLYFKDGKLRMKEDTIFIFMGDAVDKGPGAIRILELLNDLKRHYPQQYIQLAGNRDIKKMRLPNELSDSGMEKAPRNPNVSTEAESWKLYYEWLNNRPDNKINRLKYILEVLMGADKAFGFRREEMALLKGLKTHDITDEAVLNSFLSDFAPSGRMTTFIKNSQMLYLTNDGTLAAHGFVGEENFGYVPFDNNKPFTPPKSKNELEAWVNEVNKQTKELIDLWVNELDDGSLTSDSRWMELIRFQEPIPNTGANALSFIYGRYSDKQGNPQLPTRKFLADANNSGLKRVIVGHTPTGEYPVTLRDPATGFQVALIDTSKNEEWAPQIGIQANKLSVAGWMRDMGDVIVDSDPYIGLKTFDDAHVLGRVSHKNEYVLHKIGRVDDKPFVSTYEKVNLQQLKAKLSNRPDHSCIKPMQAIISPSY